MCFTKAFVLEKTLGANQKVFSSGQGVNMLTFSEVSILTSSTRSFLFKAGTEAPGPSSALL